MSKAKVIQGNKLQEVDSRDVDVEFLSPNQFVGSHVNLIPMHNAVQSARLFYGGRFYDQALPLKNREAPLVQNLADGDERGRSFDEIMGERGGALYGKEPGTVKKVDNGRIVYENDAGERKEISLYDKFPYNRKTSIRHIPKVKPGDKIDKDSLLATSNYTDDGGALALGLNARVAVVPYKGYSVEDAIVVSDDFAKRLTSEHTEQFNQDFDQNTKGGKDHFRSLFPTKFKQKQLDVMDGDGVVLPGTVLNPGDPMILATQPRVLSSSSIQSGKLSKVMRQARTDSSTTWEGEEPGKVVDVVRGKKGVRVVVDSEIPSQESDKIVFRSGNKAIISKILPRDKMPRTLEGDPMDVLLNPLSLPSRVNSATTLELALGKVARKLGKPIKIPAFNGPTEKWYEQVEELQRKHGVKDKEQLYDPVEDKIYQNPVQVGDGYILKLHHVGAGKRGERGIGSYDCYDQETEVLTSRGWVKWPHVRSSDLLYTPDLEGSRAFYEKPERLVSYDYEGDLLGYESRKLDFLVTPNHKIAYATPKVSRWRELTAEKLRDFKVLTYVPKFGFPLIEENPPTMEFPGVKDGKVRHLKHREPLVVNSFDFVELCAWWASEGSVDEEGRLCIWQSKDKNPENWDRIEKLLTRVTGTIPWNFYDRGLRINDKRIGMYLKEYGGRCYEKKLPVPLIKLSGDLALHFISVFAKGDGTDAVYNKEDRSKGNRIVSISSSSVKLLEGIQILSIHAGLGMHYTLALPAGRKKLMPCGREYTTKVDNYAGNIHLSLKRAQVVPDAFRDSRYKGRWRSEYYSGKVYCATTSTGYLMIRRNGKVMVSGNSDQQPVRGGGENAQAKRLSGLETQSMLSSGAYANLREGATVRGQKNDEFWRALRTGQPVKYPGEPFVWGKFQALLAGAGIEARKMDGGKIRLGPMTDRELERRKAVRVNKGELVNPKNLEPIPGGLFDPDIVSANKWGYIDLPFPVVNPAFEDSILKILGLTKQQFRDVLAGRAELPRK